MRHDAFTFVLPGVFAPTLSLESLCARVDPDDADATFDAPDDVPSIDEHLQWEQGFDALDHFVDGLPNRDREIVKRLFWQDQTQTEIAAAFGVSKMAISKAVKRICQRGRVELAAHEHLTFM